MAHSLPFKTIINVGGLTANIKKRFSFKTNSRLFINLETEKTCQEKYGPEVLAKDKRPIYANKRKNDCWYECARIECVGEPGLED